MSPEHPGELTALGETYRQTLEVRREEIRDAQFERDLEVLLANARITAAEAALLAMARARGRLN